MDKIGIRPLVLGYLATNSKVKKNEFWTDIRTIFENLHEKNIEVISEDEEVIEVLLDYLEVTNYISRSENYICFSSEKKKIFNQDFISSRLFNLESPDRIHIISAYKEVGSREKQNY